MAPRGYAHHWRGPDYEPDLDNDVAVQPPLQAKHTMARDLAKLRTELARAQKTHNTHLSSCTATQQHNASTLLAKDVEIYKARRDLQTIHTQHTALQTQHAALQTSDEQTRAEIVALEARLACSVRDVETAGRKNEVLEERVCVLRGTVAALRKTITALESRVEVLERPRRGEVVVARLRGVLLEITRRGPEDEWVRGELRGLIRQIMRDEEGEE